MNLTRLEKAVNSLNRAISVYNKTKIDSKDTDLLKVLEAGVIQNLEFTYELCSNHIKKWLELNIRNDIADGISRRELFRIAFENKLIDDVEKWFYFHIARNVSSHTYDSDKAEIFFNSSEEFLEYSMKLLKELEKRNDLP